MRPARDRLCFRRTGDLIAEDFAGKAVVFDPQTGETLFLSELPVLLLKHIDRVPASVDSIVSRLIGPDELDPDAMGNISSALAFLERSELVACENPN